MSAGGALNIAGTAVRAAGIDGQFGTKMLGAWGTYFQSKLAAKDAKLQADQIGWGASDSIANANALTASAAKAQRSGEEEAVNRYLALGQDIGRIYAGAAGGKIDVASGTVGEVDSAARLMASRDIAAINANTADRANAYLAEATSARIDAINQQAQAKMLRIEATLQKKLAKSAMRSQIISAAGQWQSAHAQNASDMMSGFS